MKIIGLVGLVFLLASLAAYAQMGTTAATDGPKTAAVVDANGDMRVPDGYRTTYEFLGSWAVAADEGAGSHELHVVYSSPGTIAAYRQRRAFPRGLRAGEGGVRGGYRGDDDGHREP